MRGYRRRRALLLFLAATVVSISCVRSRFVIDDETVDCEKAGSSCSLGSVGAGDGGPALEASFGYPRGFAVDTSGNLFVADTFQNRIRRIDADGVVETVAGNGESDDLGFRAGGAALETAITRPDTVAACSDGWVYWSSWAEQPFGLPAGDNLIYGLNPGTGLIELVSDAAGAIALSLGTSSHLSCTRGGQLLVPEGNGHRIWAINRGDVNVSVANVTIPAKSRAVIAGTGTAGAGANGIAATASAINSPDHAVELPDGSIVFADTGNHRIRKIAGGVVQTIAGTGTRGFAGDGGAATAALLNSPTGVAYDGQGRLFIADHDNARIRMVNIGSAASLSFGGITVNATAIDTVAGTGLSDFPYLDGSAPRQQAFRLSGAPPLVAADGAMLVLDGGNAVIRRIDPASPTMTVIAGYADEGRLDGAWLEPTSIAVLDDGSLRMTAENAYLWRVDPESGDRDTVAGTGSPLATGDEGPARDAGFWGTSVAARRDVVVVADARNFVVREIDADGVIRRLAGTGVKVNFGTGDGGAPAAAALDAPTGVAVDSAGNLFIADDDRIRMINRTANPIVVGGVTVGSGQINRIAGTNASGYGGDGGLATNATFDMTESQPTGLAVGTGVLFIADHNNHRIRKVDLALGTITTFAGNGNTGYAGDGLPPNLATVGRPLGLAIHDGYLYWSQSDGAIVRRAKLSGSGIVERVAGTGRWGLAGERGPRLDASLSRPFGLAIGADGVVYVTDWNHRIRRIVP